MYGNNINIISTKAGFGVNYDGLISSKEDVALLQKEIFLLKIQQEKIFQ